jgi:hypothetical protein
VLPRLLSVSLSPLARTLVTLVLAGGALALMPVPPATSAPARAVPVTAPVAQLP